MNFRRLRSRWWLWRNSGPALNRRVVVENYLFKAASGKVPLPDKEKCRELAIKLGVAEDWAK